VPPVGRESREHVPQVEDAQMEREASGVLRAGWERSKEELAAVRGELTQARQREAALEEREGARARERDSERERERLRAAALEERRAGTARELEELTERFDALTREHGPCAGKLARLQVRIKRPTPPLRDPSLVAGSLRGVADLQPSTLNPQLSTFHPQPQPSTLTQGVIVGGFYSEVALQK
jgi:chromosome segregation ATPase